LKNIPFNFWGIGFSYSSVQKYCIGLYGAAGIHECVRPIDGHQPTNVRHYESLTTRSISVYSERPRRNVIWRWVHLVSRHSFILSHQRWRRIWRRPYVIWRRPYVSALRRRYATTKVAELVNWCHSL